MSDERAIESRVFCQVFTQYMYQSQIVIRSASYISEKSSIYMGKRVLSAWGNQNIKQMLVSYKT
jgi:hypothetical protein